MKILILSTSHPFKTSGVAAFDIYKGFKEKEGNKVKMVVKIWDKFPDKDIIPIDNYFTYTKARILRKLRKVLIKNGIIKNGILAIDPEYHVQDYDQTKLFYSTKRILKKSGIKPDVIFVIFAQGLLNFRNLFELKKLTGAHIYWQLADMAPFTGLCHYAWDCEGYKNVCGKCPAIFSNDSSDRSNSNLTYKKKFINDMGLRIIIGSEWLLERAKNSSLLKNIKISKIYLSVDENQFHPVSSNDNLRDVHKISKETFIIGFGANGLNEKRKGIQYILDAVNLIKTDKKLLFIYVGNQLIQQALNHPTKFLGLLNRNELPDFYRLCDLFVSASLQDVGPYMILESLMCGVPVVSFNTGIASDYVMTDITGVLVDTFSSEALSDGIIRMLAKNQQEINTIKQNCFNNTKEKVSLEKQIENYNILFKEDKILK